MTRRILRALPPYLGVLNLPASLRVLRGGPWFWQRPPSRFLKGDVDQLSIDEHGRLTLGPSVTRSTTPAPFVVRCPARWFDAPRRRQRRQGDSRRSQRHRHRVLRQSEMEVHARRRPCAGGVFVATSPDGRIYRVDARGQATTFFDETKYIWALAVDRLGNLFAATGDKGVVYKIRRMARAQVFLDQGDARRLTGVRKISCWSAGSPGRVFASTRGKDFLARRPARGPRASHRPGVIYRGPDRQVNAGGGGRLP